MESDAEWVEIKCPRTGEPMFANLATGDCLWEPPVGAVVKESNENQWWELYDVGSGRNYYHNCTTNTTVWRKPLGADILPLSKLQAKSAPTASVANNTLYQNNGTGPREDSNKTDPLSDPQSISPDFYNEEVLANTPSTNTLDRNSLSNKLPPISPYAVKPNHSVPPGGQARPNKQGKIPPPIASKPATMKRGSSGSRDTPQSRGEDSPSSRTDNNGTDVFHSDPYPKQTEHSHLAPDRNNGSRTSRSIEDLSNLDSDHETAPTFRAVDPDQQPPLPGDNHKISLNEKLKQNRHESRYQSFHDFSAPAKYSDGKIRTSTGANEESNNTGSTLDETNPYVNWEPVGPPPMSPTHYDQSDDDQHYPTDQQLQFDLGCMNSASNSSLDPPPPPPPHQTVDYGPHFDDTCRPRTSTYVNIAADCSTSAYCVTDFPSPIIEKEEMILERGTGKKVWNYPALPAKSSDPASGIYAEVQQGRSSLDESAPVRQHGLTEYENIQSLMHGQDRGPYVNWNIVKASHEAAKSPSHQFMRLKSTVSTDSIPGEAEPDLADDGLTSTYAGVEMKAFYDNVDIRRRSNPIPRRTRSARAYSSNYTDVKILPPRPSEIDLMSGTFDEDAFRGSRDYDISPVKQRVRGDIRSMASVSDTELIPKRRETMASQARRESNSTPLKALFNFFKRERSRSLTNLTCPEHYDITQQHLPDCEDKQRRHSTEISPTPQKEKKGFGKKPVGRSPTSPIPKIAKDKEFVKKNINRPRGMFKKVSIATMLAYSKDPIKKPIILTQDKEVRKCAVDYFKSLQEYMGDIKSGKSLKERERLKRAVELTYNGWQKKCFRDEFYMQVIKQTTCNSKPKSLEWGWKLITAYLYYFPPTTRFQGYLEGYLYKNKENDFNQGVRVCEYAEYCYERLNKMVVRGAKPGQKKPNEDDIAHAMELPFKKSMFGATLDEVMELQRDTHPNHHIPWVLTLLAEKVIECGGYTTEGIFRVPGDIDRVGTLKVAIDNGDYLREFPTSDAPVCASLLKEWLREMYDPVIPGPVIYQKCLDNCKEPAYCSTIINNDLPNINRLVVTFVIRFLQGFLKEDRVTQTKMTADNLAMVFAPNLLRCPSTDLQVAMDNSKWEMTFVRTLINNLDTSYMDGVV